MGTIKASQAKELRQVRWKDNLLSPMLSHSTVLEWGKEANYHVLVLFSIWIFIRKEKLTSGIPEPQA